MFTCEEQKWNSHLGRKLVAHRRDRRARLVDDDLSGAGADAAGGGRAAGARAARVADAAEQCRGRERRRPGADETYTLSELEYLLGPIALYPDTLLALIFPAAAQPDQILDASKWLDENAEAVKNSDFSGVDGKSWDTSVQALTRFPDVIQMLAGHLDWTESLGAAFNLQPDDVSTAIQLLARAGREGRQPQDHRAAGGRPRARRAASGRSISPRPIPSASMCRPMIPPPCSPRRRSARWPSPPASWSARPGTIAGAGTTGAGTRCGSIVPAGTARRTGTARRRTARPAPGVPTARTVPAARIVRTAPAVPIVRACARTVPAIAPACGPTVPA